jgi:alpha-L-fucosidase
MKGYFMLIIFFFSLFIANGQPNNKSSKPLLELQNDFVNLKFGIFIHFNIGTFVNHDWPDPEASPELFNPQKLDCKQWAKAAASANMAYGCLTTKHHNGFCIWDTKTTNYNVMQSPLKRDVVREFVNAFRENGLKVMLYYSILDTHHKLRPNEITPQHVALVKKQITELLTNYGEIHALIIDGWDAPWSRISYDEIPFKEIYKLVKSLQPNCLLMDLNSSKYPPDGMYYTDIKTYEMGAGQRINGEKNKLPAMGCLPLNSSWFWKTDFPQQPVKDPAQLVKETIIPLNKANCNFILNVAPNRDGLFDENALTALTEIGRLWKDDSSHANLENVWQPVISTNLARNMPSNSSWSYDMNIMDFANDDNFRSSWESNPEVKNPWYEVDLKLRKSFTTIVIVEEKPNIKKYKLEYFENNSWKTIFEGENTNRIKVHRFTNVSGTKVRIQLQSFNSAPSIAEFEIYDE